MDISGVGKRFDACAAGPSSGLEPRAAATANDASRDGGNAFMVTELLEGLSRERLPEVDGAAGSRRAG